MVVWLDVTRVLLCEESGGERHIRVWQREKTDVHVCTLVSQNVVRRTQVCVSNALDL